MTNPAIAEEIEQCRARLRALKEQQEQFKNSPEWETDHDARAKLHNDIMEAAYKLREAVDKA